MTVQLPSESALGPIDATSLPALIKRIRTCAQCGLFELLADPDTGEPRRCFRELVSLYRQLGRQTRDPGLILSLHAHTWGALFPVLHFGSAEQKRHWLPGLLDGSCIGGHAITESQGGSDLQAMKATATVVDGGYRLNGRKCFVSNAPIADLLVVYAQVDRDEGGLTAFLVRPDDEGVDVGAPLLMEGCKTSPMGDIALRDVALPDSRTLGIAGAGAMLIQAALERERAFVFAGIVGVMEWQLQHVITVARRRTVGKRQLGDIQAVAHKIAAMKMRLDTAWLWIDRCADLADQGRRITLESAEAKAIIGEAFIKSSLDAVHIMGAHGLVDRTLTGLVSDAMAGRLFSGSTEVMYNIVAAMQGVGKEK